MQMSENPVYPIDMLTILDAVPGNHLILLPDAPCYTIVGASADYLATTSLIRQHLPGQPAVDALPGN